MVAVKAQDKGKGKNDSVDGSPPILKNSKFQTTIGKNTKVFVLPASVRHQTDKSWMDSVRQYARGKGIVHVIVAPDDDDESFMKYQLPYILQHLRRDD